MKGLLLASLLFTAPTPWPGAFVPPPGHDVLHYDVTIAFGDSGTRITADVTVRWIVGPANPLRLDLDTAVTVSDVWLDGVRTTWRREAAQVIVPHRHARGDTATVRVAYAGDVTGGLVLRGDGATRTVFADNWPDRARQWLVSVDHPSDKATVDWHIRAPLGLTVVAVGSLTRVDTLKSGGTEWHFHMADPTPVHTMVLGAASLATTRLPPAQCARRCVPVSVVTYPRDSAFAVDGPFRRAGEMIDVFAGRFGPFPFTELRHVESSTIFGGMENSTAIFYDQSAYQNRSLREATVAHETAHQWFGDALSQTSWSHLWLSEGFATYGAALWAEHVGGRAGLREAMERARATVMRSEARTRPVLDSTASLMALLNANNYQKGAWILHSLRGMLGDDAFFRGLRAYVAEHMNGNVLSEDFARAMSTAAGRDLGWYFDLSLRRPGYPVFTIERVTTAAGSVTVTLTQVQDPAWGLYRLPGFGVAIGGTVRRADIHERVTHLTFPATPESAAVVLDPDGWWLFDVRGER